MIKFFALIGLMIFIFIVAITRYLGPDDLGKCTEPAAVGTCQVSDAIVVVSGGDTNARVREGVTLFKQGWGKQLIFSGAAADETGLSNAQAMKKYAVKLGVSEAFISTEEFSRNTAENARNTSRYIEQNKLSRIILVTSAYHQRRASLEFSRRVGDTVQIINHPVASDRQWSAYWWATPIGWWLVIGEIGKIGIFYVAPEGTI